MRSSSSSRGRSVVLKPGETIISISAAGGGYGPPLERDPEHVRHDVADGWVSAERARDTYGVVLATDGSVDETATAARREELAKLGATPAAEQEGDSVLELIEPGRQLWPTGG